MTVITVDDTDTSRITYRGDWTLLKGNSGEWQSTTHSAWRDGSQATFKFRGTSVTVLCTVPEGSSDSSATFRIDNGREIEVSKDAGDDDVPNVQFFSSGKLPLGDHTLVITEEGEEDFRLDRIQYDDGILTESSTLISHPSPSFTLPPTPNVTTVKSTVIVTETTRDLGAPAPGSTTLPTSGSSSAESRNSTSQTHTLSFPTLTTVIDSVGKITITEVHTSVAVSTSIPDSVSGAPIYASNEANHSVRLGPIIGASLGGLFLLFLLCIVVLLYRRCKRNEGTSSHQGFSRHLVAPWLRQPDTSFPVVPYNVEMSTATMNDLENARMNEKNREEFETSEITTGTSAEGITSSIPDQHSTFSSSEALSPMSENRFPRSTGTTRRGHLSADTCGGLSYLSKPPPPFGYPIHSGLPTHSRVPSYHSLVPHSYGPKNQ